LEVFGVVTNIEKAFNITLGVYHHPTESRDFYAPDVQPTVDASLPVLYLQGLDNFFIPKPSSLKRMEQPAATQPNDASGTQGYLGSDFRNAYAPGVSLTGAGQVVGLVEFDGYTPGDTTEYQNLAGVSPLVPVIPILEDSVTNSAGPANTEVSLDIEMAIAMAPGLKQVSVYEGIYDTSVMNEIVTPTQGEPLPQQVSCSWGIGGDRAIINALIEMEAQGQSFYYASGDYGAFPPATTTNANNLPLNYMTTVGGTTLTMTGAGAAWNSEVVWNGGCGTCKDATGGGILVNVPIPSYQVGVSMADNNGSTEWRNVPDVAACASGIEIVTTLTFTNGNPNIPGVVTSVGGTSAAAPLWAGFTALVNQQANSEGKANLGFPNPAIYEIGQGPGLFYNDSFHDITVGNNYNAKSPNLYSAAVGYDLCTGWGSPTGQSLIDLLIGLAAPVYVDFNYTGNPQNGGYNTPFKTLAQGTNGVSAYGTIFIKTAGSSPETMIISKPLTITALAGPAVVGN
jgi:subtilase family serine protease